MYYLTQTKRSLIVLWKSKSNNRRLMEVVQICHKNFSGIKFNCEVYINEWKEDIVFKSRDLSEVEAQLVLRML